MFAVSLLINFQVGKYLFFHLFVKKTSKIEKNYLKLELKNIFLWKSHKIFWVGDILIEATKEFFKDGSIDRIDQVYIIIWDSAQDFCSYFIGEQQRYAQTPQSLPFSHTQSMEIDGGSVQILNL